MDPETEEWTRIQTMEAPDFFGERSLTGGEMTSADVIVSSESCLLLILAKRDFDTVVAEYPKFRRQMHDCSIFPVPGPMKIAISATFPKPPLGLR